MLFSNVFNGLTQVAKSVVGLIKGEQIEPVTYHEHDLQPLAPTVEPLLVESPLNEIWVDVDMSDTFGDMLIFKLSNFGNYSIKYKSVKANEWRTSVSKINRHSANGNPYLHLQHFGKKKAVNMSRLMMSNFGSPKPDYIAKHEGKTIQTITYNDGNALNIHIENLRWVSEKEFNVSLEAHANGVTKAALQSRQNAEERKKAKEQMIADFVIPESWKIVDGSSWSNERNLYVSYTPEDGVQFFIQKKPGENSYRQMKVSGSLGGNGRYLTVTYSEGQKFVNAAKAVLVSINGLSQPSYASEKMPAVHYEDGDAGNLTPSNLRWLTEEEIKQKLKQRGGHNRSKLIKLPELTHADSKNIEQELEAKRAKKEEAEKQRLAKIEQDIQKEVDRQFKADFDEYLDSLTVEQDEAQASHDRRVDKVLSGVEKIKVKAEDKQTPVEDIQPKFDGNIDFQKAMREEIWLEIPTYEGAYEISSFGNVRSIGRFVTRHRIVKVKNGTEEERRPYQYFQVGKRLKPSMVDGALEISLSKGGKQSRLSIAKLVLVVFAKDKLKSANFNVIHLNGNLNNCRLNNLLIADEAQAA